MNRALIFSAVLLGAACGAPAASPSAPHAPVLAAVQPARLQSDVTSLVSFGTRHTLSNPTSRTRGIGAARAWIAAELGRVPGVQTALDAHVVPADGKRLPHDTEIVDVVGVLAKAARIKQGRAAA